MSDQSPHGINQGAAVRGEAVAKCEPTAKKLIAQLHDGQEWNIAEQQAFASFMRCFPNESSAGMISLGDAWKNGQAYAEAMASARAADAPSEPSRADLEAIDRAMQHMGDALNALDVADEDDEKITADGFAAIARLLKSRAADALDSQPAAASQASIGDDARFMELLWDAINVDEHRRTRDRIATLVAYIDSCASAAPAASVAGWISVDDRLPKESDDEVIILYWPYDNHDNPQVVGSAQYSDGTFFCYAGNEHHAPSHWMPMPPAPQQEGSEAGNG